MSVLVPRRGRRAAVRVAAAALALAVGATAACTLSPSGDEPSAGAGDGSTGSTADGSQRADATSPSRSPRPSARATGPAPSEIAGEVLAAAEAEALRPGSGSATADVDGDLITLELVEVRRTQDATLAVFRLSSDTPGVDVGPVTFGRPGRFVSRNFVRDVYLDDRPAALRYRPLTFADARPACVCPYLPLTLGPQPQTFTAVFPPLPATTTTVDLNIADLLVVADVPVAAAD